MPVDPLTASEPISCSGNPGMPADWDLCARPGPAGEHCSAGLQPPARVVAPGLGYSWVALVSGTGELLACKAVLAGAPCLQNHGLAWPGLTQVDLVGGDEDSPKPCLPELSRV